MGISNNSHGKKSDKETQSPLLKIFKDIMTREKDDPEKRNLLMGHKEDKKRRQYSGPRSKNDRRSCESSSSEHRKRGSPYKMSATDHRADTKQVMSQTGHFPEKKDSWWFWQRETQKKETEDTCSCVSCALKRLVSSEYACIACLLLLFTISIIVAFLVVFKSVPGLSNGDDTEQEKCKRPHKPKAADSERLKRKIEMLGDNVDFGGLDEYRTGNKPGYDDPLSGHPGLAGGSGIDFGPSFRELNSMEEPENKLSGDTDWSSMLETEKSSSMQSSEKLREFYKKLVQTDTKIKNLKKINQGAGFLDNGNDETILKSPDRSKRSVLSYPNRYRVIRRRRSAFSKDQRAREGTIKRRQANRTRLKRFTNESEEPTGFVIEKKKLIVQYKPGIVKKKLPVKKCSHAPKESHIHENQLKHPFYKNTQRLDELLDRFLNKNLPEIMSDPFGLDMLFNHDKTNKCKHPIPHKNVDVTVKEKLKDQIPKPKGKTKKVEHVTVQRPVDIVKLLKPEVTTHYETDFFHHKVQMIEKEKQKIVTASSNDFEVLLSVSTIMNPDIKQKTGKQPTASLLGKVPNLRRLMQLDGEEDENLGYEDFKEVLTDDMENNDDMDKRGDRKRRRQVTWNDEQPPPLPTEKYPKYNPPGVHNPNWKGPMPLYPDELNSMIKHNMNNSTKVEYPTSKYEIQAEFLERRGRDLSDVEYVEDYLSNKYDKLVEMAQAYSDYGVLDGKKENRNDKNTASDVTVEDHRVKLSADRRFNRAGLLGRLTEGIRPFTRPGTHPDKHPGVHTVSTQSYRRQRKQSHIDFDDSTSIGPGSEGIRFEIRPTTKARDDDVEILDKLKQHVKFKSYPQNSFLKSSAIHSTILSTYPDLDLIYSSKDKDKVFESSKKILNTDEDIDRENGLIFALSKNKRNLLSTDYKSTKDFGVDADTTEDSESKTDINDVTVEDFIQNFNVRKFNASKEEALAQYMERVKQNNIRIYSSVHPDLRNFSATTQKYTGHLPSISPLNQLLYAKTVNSKPKLNDTIVTINRSEIRLNEMSADNFEGKILLTVENPDFGTEHINLRFDVPLVINFNDEMMTMNDSLKFINHYSQSEVSTNFFMDQNDNETNIDLDIDADPDKSFEKITKRKRFKREGKFFDDQFQARMYEDPAIVLPNFTHNSSINYNNTINNNSYTNSKNLMKSNSSINVNHTEKKKLCKNNNDTEMSLSDFFMMISDWFKALDGAKVDKPRKSEGSKLTETILIYNDTSAIKNSTDASYPLYDSDMIENIGHRSRVLLSINEYANTTELRKEKEHANATGAKSVNIPGANAKSTPSNVTHSGTAISHPHYNLTTPKKSITVKAKEKKKSSTKKPKPKGKSKGKAIFKRNADDSNLIFWNDIYDDEYGIQNDKLDNSVRDKHSVQENDFIKRSGKWVHDKIRKFAENLKFNPRPEDMAIKERVARSVKNPGIGTYPKYIYDRISDGLGRRDSGEKEEEYYDSDQKSIFSALSANMKDVCKKAARAVQQTRNIEVREDSKQNTIAASLMQQLVRLLTDLVDYQVQQKTCTKLPPDLQNFLEWLVYPKEDMSDSQAEALTYRTPYQEEDLIEELEIQDAEEKTTDHLQDSVTETPNEKQVAAGEVRMHYLDCLHSIQDLLEQFEQMNDDEKSKMTGVKSYLESQMRYLNRQLSGYDLFTLFEKHNQMRYKRDLLNRNLRALNHRPRKRLNKYVKNFGKKHTRTTASFDDAVRVTDMKRKTGKDIERVDSKKEVYDVKTSGEVKRNLKDVYYKAIAEAKKYATAKNMHKNDEVTAFITTTNKVET